jgi:AraC-like DNA-binding protein
MTRVGSTTLVERPAMVGVYFKPAGASVFLDLPSSEVTDRVVALDDVWGTPARDLAAELDELDEAERIDRFERALVRRLARHRPVATSIDIQGLAAWANRSRGRVSVSQLADAAGVSRQHLGRTFRDFVGVSPKVFLRLARFQSGLAYAGCGERVEWARAAVELGYADQSHMIAEFREFSSLTPYQLATERWFHPFIERAKARATPT